MNTAGVSIILLDTVMRSAITVSCCLKEGEESNLIPAMGYLHIDGKGELASSGSRYNLLEAETIAAWLTDNQQDIEAHYGKSLHEVVGIVTPLALRYRPSNRRWVNKASVQARMKRRSRWAPCILFRGGKSDCYILASLFKA